jgi:hypothetical protein
MTRRYGFRVALKSLISRSDFNWVYLFIAFLLLAYWAFYFGGFGNDGARGFVQDDTFISLRYARNFVEGNGLTMNLGERVEGYTNFLWTMIMAFTLKMGWDAIFFMRALGFFLSLATATLLFFATQKWLPKNRWIRGWSVLLFASSPIVGLWTTSGMETPLMTFWVASILFIQAHVAGLTDDNRRTRLHWGILCGIVLAAAELTRPEGKALFVVVGLLQLLPYRKGGFRENVFLKTTTLIFALIIIPYHIWRLSYFGEFFPNTYYVKGAHSLFAYERGYEMMGEFFAYQYHGVLLLLVLGIFLSMAVPASGRLALGLLIFYLLYYIKIGGDEFYLYRHLMPALPVFFMLAEVGLSEWMGRAKAWSIAKPLGLCVALLIVHITASGFFSGRKETQYCTVLESLEKAQGAVGRFIAEHSNPGDKVITQDMGILPWTAPKQHFIDVMGLTDAFIAHKKANLGYSVYTRHLMEREENLRKEIDRMYQELRDYLFSQNAKWVVAVTYHNSINDAERALASMRSRDTSYFSENFRESHFYFKMGGDRRFNERYTPVGLWQYSSALYLVLYVDRVALSGINIPLS